MRKLVPTKFGYTNWNAWRNEIVRALRLQQVPHYIGVDGGVFKTCENMKCKRPEAPGQASITTEEGELTADLAAVPSIPEYVTKYIELLGRSGNI